MQLKMRRRKEIRGSRKACARPRILAAAFVATPLCVVLGCAGRVLVWRSAATPSYQDKHTPCCQFGVFSIKLIVTIELRLRIENKYAIMILFVP